jgi:hypothetical protein
MKKTLSIFFSLCLLLSNCSKVKLCEIVQTDEFGNIIDKGSSKDWIPYSLNNEDNSYMNDYISRRAAYANQPPMVLKNGCTIPDTLDLVVYPNPVKDIDNLKVKITSSKPICFFGWSYNGLNGKGSGSAIGQPSATYLDCKKKLDFQIGGQAAFPTSDMEIYFMLATADSCVYYAKGKVKVK